MATTTEEQVLSEHDWKRLAIDAAMRKFLRENPRGKPPPLKKPSGSKTEGLYKS